jgi:hypothetical protein
VLIMVFHRNRRKSVCVFVRRETEIYFKELTHTAVDVYKSKLCRID